MKCQDFREIIDSYLSDELLTETNHDVLRHLESCADCRMVVGTRREIRSRLKSAVMSAPQYKIDKNFTHNLQTQLKFEAFSKEERKAPSWFNLRAFSAVAAGLLLTFSFGFMVFSSVNPAPYSADNDYSVPGLQPSHIVNIAAGDHEHCAIRHKPEERPTTLVKASKTYENLDKIVTAPVQKVLADYDLVAAHACKYKTTEFAHLVLENNSERLSVLVTDKADSDKSKTRGIANFTAEKYRVSKFDVSSKSVFVVSSLARQSNLRVANAIHRPLKDHFVENNTIQSALLMYH